MLDWFSGLISIAMYVLQALGLYTIAQRRGIRHAWLSWIPFGSAWILGCICDDYRVRISGKKQGFRIALLVLTVAVAVLSVVTMATLFSSLSNVLTAEEILDIVAVSADPAGDLYTPTEDELIEQLAEILDTRLTDEMLEDMLSSMLACAGISLLLGGAAIAAAVIECICMYNLFESCDPANKLVFFLVGLFVGLWGVFVFVVRNKDLGISQTGQLPPPQDPWQ